MFRGGTPGTTGGVDYAYTIQGWLKAVKDDKPDRRGYAVVEVQKLPLLYYYHQTCNRANYLSTKTLSILPESLV